MPTKPRKPIPKPPTTLAELREEMRAILSEREQYQQTSTKLTAEAVAVSFQINAAIAREAFPEAEIETVDIRMGSILVPSDSGGQAEQQIAEIKKAGLHAIKIQLVPALQRVHLLLAPATGKNGNA